MTYSLKDFRLPPVFLCMNANGPAIKVGCVTGEASRLIVLIACTELSRWQAGMARVFAVMVQILLSITSVAVQS